MLHLTKATFLLFTSSWGKHKKMSLFDFSSSTTTSLEQIINLTNNSNNNQSNNKNIYNNDPILFEAQDTIQNYISTLNKVGKIVMEKNEEDYTNNNNNNNDRLMEFFDNDVMYIDTSFYNPIQGKKNLLRHFLLFQESDSSPLSIHSKRKLVIDDIAIGLDKNANTNNNTNMCHVVVQYHLEELGIDGSTMNDSVIPDSKGITVYSLRDNKIIQVFDVLEPTSPKPGNSGLKLLETVNTLLGKSDNTDIPIPDSTLSNDSTNVERYFDAWNRRDMKDAVECFSNDVIIEDLQYPIAFQGKEELEKHLLNVAKCLPRSFEFKIDKLVVMPIGINNPVSEYKEKIGVQWHVESDGEELLFTRGCSFYNTDKNGLICSGVDIPEPAGIKTGALSSISNKFKVEPVRIIPATFWLAYMYIVFFSDGILPGANALALEQRTWEEVRDLSLNFFLVSPLLHLPFAPTVHPMLEGVFNLLLSWAGLFAGFLSDERRNKPNILPFGPIVVGMQFLTSAFLLPYLALRSSEKLDRKVFKDDITGSIQATVGEWKPLGVFLGSIGSLSILWAFFGRPEFGDFNERYASFVDLLSIDRVGSSFLVDLAIFALFQGWFIDDDMKRRGVPDNEMMLTRNTAKFIPFFGLAFYLTARPQLPSRDEATTIE